MRKQELIEYHSDERRQVKLEFWKITSLKNERRAHEPVAEVWAKAAQYVPAAQHGVHAVGSTLVVWTLSRKMVMTDKKPELLGAAKRRVKLTFEASQDEPDKRELVFQAATYQVYLQKKEFPDTSDL